MFFSLNFKSPAKWQRDQAATNSNIPHPGSSLLSVSLVMVEVGVEAKWPKGSVVMGKGSHKVMAHCITDMGSWERGGGILFIKFIRALD